jgi:hypothetical protein
MINNPVDRKKINDALQEVSNSMTRIEAEKSFIKTVLVDLSDNYQLPKKTVNKLARIYHRQNFSQEAQDFEELETLYEEVVKLS